MKLFPIKKKYVYRHKMLEFLYEKVRNEPLHSTDLKKSKSSFKEMADFLKIDARLLREFHQAFHGFKDDEDHVKCFNENNEYIIGIQEPGIRAYLDDYWMNEGEKDLNERIYNKTKWIIPVFALLITAASLMYSINSIRQTQMKVQAIEQQISDYKHAAQQKVEYTEKSLPQVLDTLTKK